ncbi:hypothetical protein BV25DRAFT_1597059 [Artomyces pyxidatus]|uniref:Uncharacterized protein n=1 Tax=Artomyces pyxidatus TaxID=48021 RepID=A0ACB8TB89_9AGAM|nr:hypothetical protein BV25DRAFT_1597059 [Artomyces pyxidatus]
MPYIMHSVPPSPIAFPDAGESGPFASLGALPRRKSPSQTFIYLPLPDLESETPPPTPTCLPRDGRAHLLTARRPALTMPMRRAASASPTPSCQNSPRATAAIILSNGKPLKPSLKSAQTSPVLPYDAFSRHARTQSMPAQICTKSVQFKDKESGLESVRTFKRTGRPAALLVSSAAEDTETETEPECVAHPFPSTAIFPVIDSSRSSPVPAPNPQPDAHIIVESLTLPPTHPPTLRGTVLVRNVAFEKRVTVRFTLDDWDTVSEVNAAYAGPVSQRDALARASTTLGDVVGLCALDAADHSYDRFTFTVGLGDAPARRTLFLAARFAAPGVGEWWDNNAGANYRVGFCTPAAPVSARHRKRNASVPPRRATAFGASAPAPKVAPQEALGVFSGRGLDMSRTALRSGTGWNTTRW